MSALECVHAIGYLCTIVVFYHILVPLAFMVSERWLGLDKPRRK